MKTRSRYFTLLELIMALAVFAVVMSTVGMALFAIQRTWKKVTEQHLALQKLQMIDRIVDTALRNAVPFHWKTEDNKEIMIFTGNSDSLLLPYLHRIGRPEDGGIRFIRFYCKDSRLMVDYRNTPIIPEQENEGKVTTEVLAVDVDHISFRYADIVDRRLDWYDDWNVEKMLNMPMAIQMKVVWKDGRSEVWLRRTAGAGQFQTLGRHQRPVAL